MKKFFIVGCPRSGTTVLQQALNRHSQIVIPPETKFFFSLLGHSRASQVRHLRRINADLQIDIPAPATRIRLGPGASALYEQMAHRYVQRLQRSDAIYFGEKTPEHTGRLSRIRAVFPDAKVIFLYRDGRDVAVSLSKVPWMSSDLYVNFLVWLYYHRILLRAQHECLMDQLFVKYEDLVTNPEAEMQRILTFLNLRYEPAVTAGYGNREGIPDREVPWKARALGRITPEYVGTWKRELSRCQIGHLERLGGCALRSLGYELLTRGKALLPFGIFPRTFWNILGLSFRLPWYSIAHEFCGRKTRITPNGSSVQFQAMTHAQVPPSDGEDWRALERLSSYCTERNAVVVNAPR